MEIMSLIRQKAKGGLRRLSNMMNGSPSMDLRQCDVMVGEKMYTMYAPKEDVYLDTVGTEFEPSMVRVYRSLIPPNAYCLDIGANIGFTSILFSQIARRVDSFEPSPTTFRVLQKNVRGARAKNVHLNNIGLGSSNMESRLIFAPNNRSGGFVADRTSVSAGHTIETIKIRRLDDRYTGKEEKIDFIKIDVEGFEKSVLEGGANTIARDKPVVVLELNHFCLNVFQRITVPDFFDFLRSVFPYLYAISKENTYADLYDENDTYKVMYHHINNLNYSDLVGAFDISQLERFKSSLAKG